MFFSCSVCATKCFWCMWARNISRMLSVSQTFFAHTQYGLKPDCAAPGRVCSLAVCATMDVSVSLCYPLTCLFYYRLCYHGRICYKATCTVPGRSSLCYPWACLFYSRLFCLDVSVIQQPVLPQDVSVIEQHALPSTCLL